MYNVQDRQDESGRWLRCYTSEGVQHHTRAGLFWSGLCARCRVDGIHQTRNPTYIGVTNGFKDFQEFAEWCQTQYGYMNKEGNGKFWSLDKDLKIFGNKEYTSTACIFVPSRINGILINKAAKRGNWPVGVSWSKRELKFQSTCSQGKSRNKNLGIFSCPLEAHKAWQRYKMQYIRKICVDDKEISAHTDLVQILLAQAQRIEGDLRSHRETI